VTLHLLVQLIDANATVSLSEHDGDGLTRLHGHKHLQLSLHAWGSLAVGLVDGKEVGDLE